MLKAPKRKPKNNLDEDRGIESTSKSMGVYSTEYARWWVRHYKVFFVNSRQDRECLEKIAFLG